MDYMVECPLCKEIFEVPALEPHIYPRNMNCPKCKKKIGYWDDRELRKLGQCAVIGKGTRYHSMKDGEYHIAGKTYNVMINHWLNGSHSYEGRIIKIDTNPMISWPGSGGYWSRADINQSTVEVKISPPTF